jgi:hypothetical protein
VKCTHHRAVRLCNFLQSGEDLLAHAGPLGISDVDLIVANNTLILVLVTAGNGVTPVRVADPPTVAALSLLRAVGQMLPDEGHGGNADTGVDGVFVGEVLDRVHVQAIALPAGVDHLEMSEGTC